MFWELAGVPAVAARRGISYAELEAIVEASGESVFGW